MIFVLHVWNNAVCNIVHRSCSLILFAFSEYADASVGAMTPQIGRLLFQRFGVCVCFCFIRIYEYLIGHFHETRKYCTKSTLIATRGSKLVIDFNCTMMTLLTYIMSKEAKMEKSTTALPVWLEPSNQLRFTLNSNFFFLVVLVCFGLARLNIAAIF